jgi:putative proteasome-type protease
MTYCLGIITKDGLILASDSRTNAGYDQVNVCRKMHMFVKPGERMLTVLTSGSLSLTQSAITLLRNSFERGEGLAQADSLYAAARVLGDCVRKVSEMDREALERDEFRFNINLLLGGQVGSERPGLYMIYPQGNPISATEDSPYLQLGECKYGRPILDRGVTYAETTLDDAAKYAMLSFDSTMRSNVTVGPPVDLLMYRNDALRVDGYRRFTAFDPDLQDIHNRWEQALRRTVEELPTIKFDALSPSVPD